MPALQLLLTRIGGLPHIPRRWFVFTSKLSSARRNSSLKIGTMSRQLTKLCLFAFVVCGFGQVCTAGGEGLTISNAWVPAVSKIGGDVPLLASVRNENNAPDALMRIRCAVANFSEKHIVDRGEGAPAMRPIPSIPIAANTTVIFKPTEYHVMLLQTRQPLVVGDRFNCTLVFQKAGTIETEVEVRQVE